MFGEEFGLDYHRQRHLKLMQEVKQARLVRCLEASRRAELRTQRKAGLYQRALAAAGVQLVRLGQRMQQAAFVAN